MTRGQGTRRQPAGGYGEFRVLPWQRGRFLRLAAVLGVSGCVPLIILTTILAAVPRPLSRPATWACLLFAALLCGFAWYYLAGALGRVRPEPDGLRTSRLLRGRFIRYRDIDDLTRSLHLAARRSTMPGLMQRLGLTELDLVLVKVRTVSGRSYTLPAPRTLSLEDGSFEAEVARLELLIRRHGGLLRRRTRRVRRDQAGRSRGATRCPRWNRVRAATSRRLPALGVLAAGIGMLAAVGWGYADQFRLHEHGVTSTAIVHSVHHVDQRHTTGTIDYPDRNGNLIRRTTQRLDGPYQVGETVRIIYDPAHLDQAEPVSQYRQNWLWLAVLGAIGLFTIALAISWGRADVPAVPVGGRRAAGTVRCWWPSTRGRSGPARPARPAARAVRGRRAAR